MSEQTGYANIFHTKLIQSLFTWIVQELLGFSHALQIVKRYMRPSIPQIYAFPFFCLLIFSSASLFELAEVDGESQRKTSLHCNSIFYNIKFYYYSCNIAISIQIFLLQITT